MLGAHTRETQGFVCFMNREDAEDAMESINETDPFNVGRFLMMRWGKNVKRTGTQGNDGGLAMPPLQKSQHEGSASERIAVRPTHVQDKVADDASFRSNHGDDVRRRPDPRRDADTKGCFTGRQLERARGVYRKGHKRDFSGGRGPKLSSEELFEFDNLVRKKLSISRETICAAMAFCFDRSGSAVEIASLLKDALLDEAPLITVDMRIARLYLISDILFNSQQPGVKNAFVYRNALEKMAPEIFRSLGRHGGGNVGRMTMNKLRTAVSSVLGAWTEWSVYNPAFLDELQAAFEGKELKKPALEVGPKEDPAPAMMIPEEPPEPKSEVTVNKPRGGWTDVNEDGGAESVQSGQNIPPSRIKPTRENIETVEDIDGAAVEEEDIDGAAIEEEDVDVVAIEEDDVDGTAIEGKELDDSPVEGSNAEIDGDDIDGDDIDGEDIDGEAIVGGELDGEAVKRDDIDGEDLDGEDLDGEDLDGEDLW